MGGSTSTATLNDGRPTWLPLSSASPSFAASLTALLPFPVWWCAVWVSTWSFFNASAVQERCRTGPLPQCGNGMKCYPTDPATSVLHPALPVPYCPACPFPFFFSS